MSNNLIFISGPQRNMLPGYWLYDFLVKDGYNIIPFYMRKDDREKRGKFTVFYRIIKMIFYVLFNATRDDLILVYDNDSTGIYLGLALSIFRPSLIVHKINCMANSRERLYSPLKRPLVRKAYTHIYTTVNNENISSLYANFFNIDKSHFIPVPDSLSDFGQEIMNIKDREDKGYIFMGGATHRDYHLFIKVARLLPQYKFVAITFEKYKKIFSNAPSNIEVLYSLPENKFYEVIAHSSVVFIPLDNDLQGGQMVLFQGALLEKPLVSTDNTAIHTYFDDTSIKIMQIGDVEAAVEILAEMMGDITLREKRGKAAYSTIIKFTPEEIYKQYRSKLFIVKT